MAYIQRQLTPGQSAIGFHGSFPILAVSIDNPSGQWLLVQSQNKVNQWQVPPYTLDFAANFDAPQNSIDVLAITGPSSLISTTQGDTILITVYSDYVAPNPGNPFVTKLDQPDISQTSLTIGPMTSAAGGQAITNLLAGSTTKRIRVFSATLYDDLQTMAPIPGGRITEKVIAQVSAANFSLSNLVPPVVGYLEIGPNNLNEQIIFNPPLDLALGRDVGFFCWVARPVGNGVSDIVTVHGDVVYSIV